MAIIQRKRLSGLRMLRNDKGEIIRAAGTARDGSFLELEVKKTLKTGVPLAAFEFRQDAKTYLRIDGSISLARVIISFAASGDRENPLKLRYTVNFSRYGSTHKGLIRGQANGRTFRGAFDPRTGRSTVKVGLEGWLSRSAKTRLAYFVPVFEEMNRHYRIRNEPFEQIIAETIQHSSWRKIGRAACWGLGGLGGAIACAAAPGIGCYAGVAVFGAAASICSDCIKDK